MTRDEFNNQSLPKSDANANLETLSRSKFRELFSVHDFEIRDEFQHDKGVDLSLEIKSNANNTNIRFPVQLKATQSSKKNNDGSISFAIKISNLNYLLNDGLPAFYMLYHQAENVFYYERAHDIEKLLLEKYPDNDYPDTLTFRFNKLVDNNVIGKIHQEMLSLGFLRRNINKTMRFTEGNKTLEESIVIQKNQNVYSPSENLRFLEKHGYGLLNAGRFLDILTFEVKCYPLDKASAIFHFVCGTAAHLVGKLNKALDHFKMANQNIDDLPSGVQGMMRYYTIQSKRSLGMIDAEKSSGYIEALMDSEYVGLYLRILKAFEVYHVSEDPDAEKLKQFQQAINFILADPHCDESLKLIADSFALTVDGYRLNDQMLNYLLMHRELGRKLFVSPEKHKLRQEQMDSYNKRFNELKAKALSDKNQFTYHNICLNGIKIQYIQAFYTDIILNIDRKTLTVKSDLVPSEKKILNDQADYVGSIAKVCEQMSAWENMVAALSQQYELLHFIGDFKQADLVLKKMEKIIADNDWYGLEEKLTKLKNKGTGHEIFAEMVITSLSKIDERNKTTFG
ncbi:MULTISPECIES: DUF4365 domain-containing protein [unclassified Pedobacter]|uniref:DUF4365 domain-containing protein n=1 Tax=unclassified Pedobacter TaxID=2628915 RepID=UPI001D4B4A06|nr:MULTISPECIES: DUF4365 domain-containing protein [unclassified Pedobacter]CAH0265863.1 hypothetical protein SRABI36_03595 [Pedobacter sp. Bi36]CAH0292221.1 hypothetical protein SRABI126_04089 [Pedobacter sp. Bi126]